MNFTPEYSQLLATAVAYAKKEIDSQISNLHEKIKSDFSEEQKELSAKIVKSALEKVPLKSLPEGLIFESHLEELQYLVNKKIDTTKNMTEEAILGYRSEALSSIAVLSTKLEELQNLFSQHDHNQDYANIVHEHEQYVEKEKLEAQLDALVKDLTADIISRIIEESSMISTNISVLKKDTEEQIKSSTRKAYERCVNDLSILKQYVDSLILDAKKANDYTVKKFTEECDKLVLDISSNRSLITSVESRILQLEGELSNKVGPDYLHPNAAKVDHQHYDLASSLEVQAVKSEIERILANNAAIKNEIFQLHSSVSSKLTKNEALTKQDLDDSIAFIKTEIIKELPPPIPGKDATEWEFRVNPKDPSIFQFKKSTDKQWTSVVPSQQVQPQASFGGYIGGGGGGDVGSGSAEIIIYSDGELVDSSVTSLDFEYPLIAESQENGKVTIRLDNATGEPTGFPNRIDSLLSFNDSIRTFTIEPAAESYEVFINAIKYNVQNPISLTIDDIQGLHYFYFSRDTLQLETTTAFSEDIFRKHAAVAILYWQPAQQKAIYFADERHGITMDGATQAYLHLSFGAQYRFGLQPNNLIVDGDGSLDSHAQLSISNGRIADEDLELDITNNQPQQLSSILRAPVFYRLGSDNSWYSKTANNFAFLEPGWSPSYVGDRPAYNEKVAGTWQVLEVPENQYFLVHVIATNDIRNPVIALSGGHYANKTLAREAATVELTNIQGLPFAEFVPIATFIANAKNVYANSVNAVFVSTDAGGSFIDWRSNDLTSTVGAVEGPDEPYVVNLSGLSYTILAAAHGKRQYADIRVFNSSRREVEVSIVQQLNGDVFIESLINLSGCYAVVKN